MVKQTFDNDFTYDIFNQLWSVPSNSTNSLKNIDFSMLNNLLNAGVCRTINSTPTSTIPVKGLISTFKLKNKHKHTEKQCKQVRSQFSVSISPPYSLTPLGNWWKQALYGPLASTSAETIVRSSGELLLLPLILSRISPRFSLFY